MSNPSARHLLLALSLLATGCVQSPAARPQAAADPLDAAAVVPAAAHRSALSAYRPSPDATPGSWQDANDAVARIGGWRAYAREAAASAPDHAGSGAGR